MLTWVHCIFFILRETIQEGQEDVFLLSHVLQDCFELWGHPLLA